MKCPATVTYSKLQQRKEVSSDSRKERREYWVYNADIRAKYQWDGITYLCSTYSLAPGNGSSDIKVAQGLLKKYPVGAKTTCFVNPYSPRESIFVQEEWPVVHFVALVMTGIPTLLCFSVIFVAGRRLLRGPTLFDDADDDSGDGGDSGNGGDGGNGGDSGNGGE